MTKTFTLNLSYNEGHEYTTTVEGEEVSGVTADGSLIIKGQVSKGMYDPQEIGLNEEYVVIDITIPKEALAYAANELNSVSAVLDYAVLTGARTARLYIGGSNEVVPR
jgi:hypothetical protein